jgi:hypothetical protein
MLDAISTPGGRMGYGQGTGINDLPVTPAYAVGPDG